MTLKRQLAITLLLVLMVPLAGLLVLDRLRAALLASQPAAQHSIAQVLAASLDASLIPDTSASAMPVPVQHPPHELMVDGYADDWLDWSEAGLIELDGHTRIRLASDGLYLYGLMESRSDTHHWQLWPNSSQPEAMQITTTRPGFQRARQHPDAERLLANWQVSGDRSTLEWRLPIRLLGKQWQLAAGQDAPAWRLQALLANSTLQQQLADLTPPGQRLWLVEENGWVLADSGSTDAEYPRSDWWVSWLGQHWLLGAQAPSLPTSSLQLPPPIGQPGHEWLQRGDRQLQVMSRQAVNQAPGWHLVLEAPAQLDGLLSPATLAGMGLMALLGFLLAPLGILLASHRLRQRIAKLRNTSRQAMHDPQQRLPDHGAGDELDQLSADFNRLLDTLGEQNDYLAQLGARLGHEMRTPLTAARSSLQNLAVSDAHNQHLLQRAEDNLQRLARLLQALGEARRLEDGLVQAEWIDCDIHALARNTMASAKAIDDQHRYRCIVSETPLTVHCAPDLLVLALEKLLANAREFTPADGQIRLSLHSQADQLELRLSNSASQITPGQEEKIFDNLVSLRKNNSEQPHLGLGLHIVRLVARIHGGRVHAFNTSDGVSFVIRLPLRPCPPARYQE